MLILCEFDGIQTMCKVIENIGFQGGRLTKVVKHKDTERIVQKYGDIYKPRLLSEKF